MCFASLFIFGCFSWMGFSVGLFLKGGIQISQAHTYLFSSKGTNMPAERERGVTIVRTMVALLFITAKASNVP